MTQYKDDQILLSLDNLEYLSSFLGFLSARNFFELFNKFFVLWIVNNFLIFFMISCSSVSSEVDSLAKIIAKKSLLRPYIVLLQSIASSLSTSPGLRGSFLARSQKLKIGNIFFQTTIHSSFYCSYIILSCSFTSLLLISF